MFFPTHRIHGAGIFTYIYLIFMVDVGKYTIHGSSGLRPIILGIQESIVLFGEKLSNKKILDFSEALAHLLQ